MKEQNHYSSRVEALLETKNWDELSRAEKDIVLAEDLTAEAYESYRCLIHVSKKMHFSAPRLSGNVKENLLRQMQLRKSPTPKKAIWKDWFKLEVPLWQVSLASLAFIVLYISGVPNSLNNNASMAPANEYFQDQVDTVFYDKEQAPEDSSNQHIPQLNSSLQQTVPAPSFPASRLSTNSSKRTAYLAAEWPTTATALLPPTPALLNVDNTIPLGLMEIQG